MGYWGHDFFESDFVCDASNMLGYERGRTSDLPVAVAETIYRGDIDDYKFAFRSALLDGYQDRMPTWNWGMEERHSAGEIALDYCLSHGLRAPDHFIMGLIELAIADLESFNEPERRIAAAWRRGEEALDFGNRTPDDIEVLYFAAPHELRDAIASHPRTPEHIASIHALLADHDMSAA